MVEPEYRTQTESNRRYILPPCLPLFPLFVLLSFFLLFSFLFLSFCVSVLSSRSVDEGPTKGKKQSQAERHISNGKRYVLDTRDLLYTVTWAGLVGAMCVLATVSSTV